MNAKAFEIGRIARMKKLRVRIEKVPKKGLSMGMKFGIGTKVTKKFHTVIEDPFALKRGVEGRPLGHEWSDKSLNIRVASSRGKGGKKVEKAMKKNIAITR